MTKLISALLVLALVGCINLGDIPAMPDKPDPLPAKLDTSPWCDPTMAIPRMPKDMKVTIERGIVTADPAGEIYLKRVLSARKDQHKACTN